MYKYCALKFKHIKNHFVRGVFYLPIHFSENRGVHTETYNITCIMRLRKAVPVEALHEPGQVGTVVGVYPEAGHLPLQAASLHLILDKVQYYKQGYICNIIKTYDCQLE